MVAAVLLSRIHGLSMGQGCVAGRDEKGLAREFGHEQSPTNPSRDRKGAVFPEAVA